MDETQTAPPQGWYPDPNGSPLYRWWDGQAWGDLAPADPPSAAVPVSTAPTSTHRRRWAVAGVLALLAAGAAVLVVTLTGGDGGVTSKTAARYIATYQPAMAPTAENVETFRKALDSTCSLDGLGLELYLAQATKADIDVSTQELSFACPGRLADWLSTAQNLPG